MLFFGDPEVKPQGPTSSGFHTTASPPFSSSRVHLNHVFASIASVSVVPLKCATKLWLTEAETSPPSASAPGEWWVDFSNLTCMQLTTFCTEGARCCTEGPPWQCLLAQSCCFLSRTRRSNLRGQRILTCPRTQEPCESKKRCNRKERLERTNVDSLYTSFPPVSRVWIWREGTAKVN